MAHITAALLWNQVYFQALKDDEVYFQRWAITFIRYRDIREGEGVDITQLA